MPSAGASVGQLPAHMQIQRDNVICGSDLNYHTETVKQNDIYKLLNINNAWDFRDWVDQFRINVQQKDKLDLQFDMVGIDPAIANAFRRILIAEVPTMAIEHVFYVNNTSIITDEVLAHRLGLIPLNADPTMFDFRTREETASEKNTFVLRLQVTCRRQGSQMVNDRVYAEDLKFMPMGSLMPDETGCRFAVGQQQMLPRGVQPVDDKILVAKLRPGQAIDLEAHCIKGQGREHAKWSPVATAWYKLLPEVVITKPIMGERADAIAQECPGLFQVEGKGKSRKAKVNSAREHPKLLEKVRRMSGEEFWEDHVRLQKRKDHFLWTIESTGQPPEMVFMAAVDILAAKCDKLLEAL